MTNIDISNFADKVNYNYEKVEITFVNGKIIYGYFDNNLDKNKRDKNKWNFIELPQINPSDKKPTLVDGNKIKSIRIVNI